MRLTVKFGLGRAGLVRSRLPVRVPGPTYLAQKQDIAGPGTDDRRPAGGEHQTGGTECRAPERRHYRADRPVGVRPRARPANRPSWCCRRPCSRGRRRPQPGRRAPWYAPWSSGITSEPPEDASRLNAPELAASCSGAAPRGPVRSRRVGRPGRPVVIRNAPLLDDGTPMPTRYWLVGRQARLAIDRLEAAGGVSAAEAAVDPEELERGPPALRGRTGCGCPAGLGRPAPERRCGGHETGREVPSRPLRLVPGRRRRPCRPLGGPAAAGGTAGPGRRWLTYAAVDCGTFSTRLLVCGPGGEPLVRLMKVTGAGRGRRPVEVAGGAGHGHGPWPCCGSTAG